jgi:hypothetical protein
MAGFNAGFQQLDIPKQIPMAESSSAGVPALENLLHKSMV